MDKSRRRFLTLAGLAAAGMALGASVKSRVRGGVSELFTGAVGSTSPTTGTGLQPGAKLGMVVDLKKCASLKGCTKCMDACHKTHNVPDFGNTKDEVKWIWKEPYERTFPDQDNPYLSDEYNESTVPVFCNNCDNPPCVDVCPTQATWKGDDGIVMMDWHRCIGCRYCMAACPYGSRSFNWRDPAASIRHPNPDFPTRTKGVVEKCQFCEERVSHGLQPACVEACPEKALAFGDLNDAHGGVRRLLKDRFSTRRKPGLGTNPKIYYLV